MRRRVFVIAGEYSANPRHLPAARRTRAFLNELLEEPPQSEFEHLFFRYPNRSEDGRARPEDWAREFGLDKPVGLLDLFTSAAHRGLSSLHRLLGGGPSDYQATRDSITDLYVTAMPGLDLSERTNIGLVPQMLKGMLGLAPRTRAQFVVGTSDSGAWAFAQAVRAARVAERPATILVLAGQIIPSGYTSQYQIRTVLGEDDQARGLDMLAVGDLVMDVERRSLGLTRDEVEEHLARVSQRKFQLSNAYPAGFSSGRPAKRIARRTPYFDGADIAAPCCRWSRCWASARDRATPTSCSASRRCCSPPPCARPWRPPPTTRACRIRCSRRRPSRCCTMPSRRSSWRSCSEWASAGSARRSARATAGATPSAACSPSATPSARAAWCR
jgi:hypothetical protein